MSRVKYKKINDKINKAIVIAVTILICVSVFFSKSTSSLIYQRTSDTIYIILLGLSTIIALLLVSKGIWLVVKLGVNIRNIRRNGDDYFEKSLFNYINDKSNYRAMLVSGSWGSGKTYRVNSFFDKYYSNAYRKIFRISCFGLETRNDLLDAVSLAIQDNDVSILKTIIDCMKIIPIIGNFLYSVFKKEYTYNSVKEGSIFIFDDFERITSKGFEKNYADKQPSSNQYSNNANYYANYDENDIYFGIYNAILQTNTELEALTQIKDDLARATEKLYLDKYIVAAGLINELVDTYRVKVIIVCDTRSLGMELRQAIFEDKLACQECVVSSNKKSKQEYANTIFKGIVFEGTEKKKNTLKRFINEVTTRYDVSTIRNIRNFGAFIYAFISTAQLFDDDCMDEELLESLFFSILLAYLYRHDNMQVLKSYIIGSNICYIANTGYDRHAKTLARSCTPKARWIGYDIACYDLGRNNQPDIENIYGQWKSYKYAAVEEAIIKGEKDIKQYAYEPRHILALAYNQKESSDIDWKYYISQIELDDDQTTQKSANELLKQYCTSSISYADNLNVDFINTVFENVYRKTKETMISDPEKCSLAFGYEEYIRKITDAK